MIKIKKFVCPKCNKGNCFIIYNFDNIQCDSCKAIILNPIFRENKAFAIDFIEDIIILDKNNLKLIID